MQFYTKNDDGEYAEASQDQIDTTFRDRFDRFKRSESAKIREEVETTVREELEPKLTEQIEERLKGEYQPKLDDATSQIATLDVKLRRKTIAAEYGFGSDVEDFLGEGSDEDMRSKADVLRKNIIKPTDKAPEKKTEPSSPTVGIVTKKD